MCTRHGENPRSRTECGDHAFDRPHGAIPFEVGGNRHRQQREVDRLPLPQLGVGLLELGRGQRNSHLGYDFVWRAARVDDAIGDEEVADRNAPLTLWSDERRDRVERHEHWGVSAEWAATHFFPTLVTQQTVPSFLRQ